MYVTPPIIGTNVAKMVYTIVMEETFIWLVDGLEEDTLLSFCKNKNLRI